LAFFCEKCPPWGYSFLGVAPDRLPLFHDFFFLVPKKRCRHNFPSPCFPTRELSHDPAFPSFFFSGSCHQLLRHLPPVLPRTPGPSTTRKKSLASSRSSVSAAFPELPSALFSSVPPTTIPPGDDGHLDQCECLEVSARRSPPQLARLPPQLETQAALPSPTVVANPDPP